MEKTGTNRLSDIYIKYQTQQEPGEMTQLYNTVGETMGCPCSMRFPREFIRRDSKRNASTAGSIMPAGYFPSLNVYNNN
jgi:hypothetical protein